MDVRIYALGEGRNGQMFDYGWITSADSRKRVWEMRYDDTEGAGGDAKNRLVDTTVRLEKGSYIVHYISDDSHSAEEWNASAPPDGRRWGITVLAAQGTLDPGAVAPLRRQGRSVGPRAAHRGARRRPGPQALHARSRQRRPHLRARRRQRRRHARLRLDRGREDRPPCVGNDVPDHRARRRRRQEPPLRGRPSSCRRANTSCATRPTARTRSATGTPRRPTIPDMWGITVYRAAR